MILVRLLFREELLRSSLTYFVNKFLELVLGVNWLLELLFLEACVLPRQKAAFIPILRWIPVAAYESQNESSRKKCHGHARMV